MWEVINPFLVTCDSKVNPQVGGNTASVEAEGETACATPTKYFGGSRTAACSGSFRVKPARILTKVTISLCDDLVKGSELCPVWVYILADPQLAKEKGTQPEMGVGKDVVYWRKCMGPARGLKTASPLACIG